MSSKTLTPQSIMNTALAMIGRPPKLIAKLGDLYDVLGNTLEHYQNKMDIHDGNFILKKKVVTLAAGRLEASFTEDSWGRPVMCDLDPEHLPAGIVLPRRDVDLIAIQDMDQYRTNVATAGSSSGVVTSDGTRSIAFAQAVAWYREGNQIKLFFEFGGYTPAQQTTYRFFYQPGGISEVIEDQEVDWLPNFVGLLQVDLALALLPLSDIQEPMYSRLEKRFLRDLQRREPVLDQWLQHDHTEQSGSYSGYNRSRIGGHLTAR